MPVHSHEGLLDENEGLSAIALSQNFPDSHFIQFILVLFLYGIAFPQRFQMYFICGADGCGMKDVLQIWLLTSHHNDLFDRLLIAQSQVNKLPIITADTKFALYNVSVIW